MAILVYVHEGEEPRLLGKVLLTASRATHVIVREMLHASGDLQRKGKQFLGGQGGWRYRGRLFIVAVLSRLSRLWL